MNTKRRCTETNQDGKSICKRVGYTWSHTAKVLCVQHSIAYVPKAAR